MAIQKNDGKGRKPITLKTETGGSISFQSAKWNGIKKDVPIVMIGSNDNVDNEVWVLTQWEAKKLVKMLKLAIIEAGRSKYLAMTRREETAI